MKKTLLLFLSLIIISSTVPVKLRAGEKEDLIKQREEIQNEISYAQGKMDGKVQAIQAEYAFILQNLRQKLQQLNQNIRVIEEKQKAKEEKEKTLP